MTTLLAESKVGGLGIAIDIMAQRRVFPYSLELSYYRAFLDALHRVRDVAKNVGEIAELTFDISTENEYNAGLLYSIMREADPGLFEWLHPKISFVPARECPRVQAADLLAYEAWKAADHEVGPVKRNRKSWDVLRATDRFETLVYDEQWFTDLKADIESGGMQQRVRFDQRDYEEWLLKRKRQPNLSNMFQFIDWIRKRNEQ